MPLLSHSCSETSREKGALSGFRIGPPTRSNSPNFASSRPTSGTRYAHTGASARHTAPARPNPIALQPPRASPTPAKAHTAASYPRGLRTGEECLTDAQAWARLDGGCIPTNGRSIDGIGSADIYPRRVLSTGCRTRVHAEPNTWFIPHIG